MWTFGEIAPYSLTYAKPGKINLWTSQLKLIKSKKNTYKNSALMKKQMCSTAKSDPKT
jgi:hypothetical protein